MKSAGRPILAAIRGRAYAAQAAARTEQPASQATRVTHLPSGAVVATVENNSPISRLAVLYNAGSRSENGDNLGVTHALRCASNLSTQNTTAFKVTRGIQQIGGSLSCSTTREHTIFSVDCVRNGVDEALEILRDVSTVPAFKRWELPALLPVLELELAQLAANPSAQLLEGLHGAAFRDTLGRSIYMPANRVGTHSTEVLEQFVKANFLGGNMAVVGTGVDHDALVFKVKQFHVAQGDVQQAPAKYYGGESRLDTPSGLTQAAIVTQGLSLGSGDLLALGVLQHLLGTGPHLKYSANVAASKLGQAAATATANPFAVSALNASYSDSGLFGFHVVGQAGDMGKLLPALVAAVSATTKAGAFTEADVTRAKNQLKASILMSGEDGASVVGDMGLQALLSGTVTAAADVAAAVDAVTIDKVQKVAQKVINSGKPSMAAVGNLSTTPYLDQLI